MGGETAQTSANAASVPRYSAAPVAHQIHSIYKERLKQFTDHGQYESASLWGYAFYLLCKKCWLTLQTRSMYEGRATGEDHVQLSVYSPPDLSRPNFKEATSHEFNGTSVGQWFGPSWSTHWLKVEIKVPHELQKKEHLELHWDAGNEGLIWTEDGDPIQGLTGGERIEWILPQSFRDGEFHTIYIEMACNGMFGNPQGGDTIQPPETDRYFQLQKADIVAVNLEARALYIDFWIIGGRGLRSALLSA
jgi:alpha-mannosidase